MPDNAVRMFEWTEALRVDCAEIDAEHRSLFEMAEGLHQAMLDGRGRGVLSDLLERLSDYCNEHFAHEERLMLQYNFPGTAGHRELHRGFRERIDGLKDRHRKGETTMTLEMLQMLSSWLTHHVAHRDRELGVHVSAVRQRA